MNLRVLMFGWEFPPQNSGGLGTACRGIIRALSDLSCRVTFVLPKKMPVAEKNIRLCFADIPEVNVIGLQGFFHPYITPNQYKSCLSSQESTNCYGQTLLEEVRLYGLRAQEITKRENFDIIHAHDWLTFPAGIIAKRVSGKPLIIHVHATEFDRSGGTGVNPDVYKIEKEGMEVADGIIAISDRTRDMVIEKYGINPDKVRAIHNGIEHQDKDLSYVPDFVSSVRNDGYKIVLFVGRLTLQKGPDYFLKAAKEVLRLRPKTYFVIAGSGDMENQVIRQAAELGIADKVIFAGFLRGRELDGLYHSADLYVMPSVSEPFGLTPLESLQTGTPVLVSHQSGVAEILSNALKTDFWDIEDMASKMVAVIDWPQLRNVLSCEGCRETKNISWHKSSAKYIDYYKYVLGLKTI